jgi:putative NADPH-quinone reductase
MSHHIAIIQGHPDPAGGHLCHALADAYAEGVQEGSHQVSRIEVAGLDFPFLRSIADSELPEVLVGPKAALLAANHIVVIFPFGFRFMPVPIKAFFQQIMLPRMAFQYKKGPPPKPFKGRSARIIVTMGAPVFFYRFNPFGGPDDIKHLKRDMSLVGIAPVHESLFGMVEAVGTQKISKWLAQMRELGAKAL